MSQDPSQNPYDPSAQNPYGNPPPQNPYDPSTQPPYGPPPQGPYGPPPQAPYAPQPGVPYGPPPQAPYGPPPDGPYRQPPEGNFNGYGYGQPPSQPLPLGQALQQLPQQYIRVLTKPSAQTFAQEMGKASWDIVWVELIIYAIIATILSYLRASIFGVGAPVAPNSPISPATIQAIQAGSSIGLIVLVPIGFFISVGIYYALAKAFHGQGTFLQQGYTQLLISVPIGLVSLVLEFIPILGSIAAFALGIYAIVLNVFAIMAVHRLSGGKATWVVLIPVIVAFVLACVLFFVFIAAILAMMRR